MEKIVPRWEWRTFGDGFGNSEDLIRQHKQTANRQSSEIYILSSSSNDNTKIRDELMDIKTPIRLTDAGLEQWTVLMKAGFPIHINDLAVVYKAFGLKMPYFGKDEYTYDEYIGEIIKPNEDLTMVDVFKHRCGYLIDEAIVEIADVTFNGFPLKTVAVEHTDPELVLATVKKLGLLQFENINYIKAMKRTFNLTY